MNQDDMKQLCSLYDNELLLMDKYNNDINNDNLLQEMQHCHEERVKLQGEAKLYLIYETVRGVDNPVTIDLYFEEAGFADIEPKSRIELYEHILDGCVSYYGENGEKTIECKLNIVIWLKQIIDEFENGNTDYWKNQKDIEAFHDKIISILEEIVASPHRHPLYENHITNLLCDEYVLTQNIERAKATYETWRISHSLENIQDIEELDCWVEYTKLLAETGCLREAVNAAEHIYIWIKENLNHDIDNQINIIRDMSVIYEDCALYGDAISVIENFLSNFSVHANNYLEDLFLLKAQLAHCYALSGEHVLASKLILELNNDLSEIQLPKKFYREYREISIRIVSEMEDYEQAYEESLRLFLESKSIYGENNEFTLLLENNLAEVCFELYKKTPEESEVFVERAEAYFDDAIQHSEFSRGKNNMYALMLKQNKAEVMASRGKYEDAIILLQEVGKVFTDSFSDENYESAYAMGRCAVLALEIQQSGESYADWIDEIEPEPFLKKYYYSMKKHFGPMHKKTLEAFCWYIRAILSRELSGFVKAIEEKKMIDATLFRETYELSCEFFANIGFLLGQAYYINGVIKQNEYLEYVYSEIEIILWTLINIGPFLTQDELIKYYELIAGYKNISYDMQFHKLSNADQSIKEALVGNTTSVSEKTLTNIMDLSSENKMVFYHDNIVADSCNCLQSKNAAFMDFWELESGDCVLFIIDSNGIRYNDLDISITDNLSEEQSLSIAKSIVSRIAGDVSEYEIIYYNLQKSLLSMPIGNYLYTYSGVPAIFVPSINEIKCIDVNRNENRNSNVSMIGDESSIDYRLLYGMIKVDVGTLKDGKISGEGNIICVTGHGYYDEQDFSNESKRNYIVVGDDIILYAEDIMRSDFSSVNLVLLPICQTGLGAVYSSFGTYSLGKSCMLAGAQYVLETLWDIPLISSLIFEYEFFNEYRNNHSVLSSYNYAINRLRRYTNDDIRRLCKYIGEVVKDKELARKVFSFIDISKEYPFASDVFWAGFSLAGRGC